MRSSSPIVLGLAGVSMLWLLGASAVRAQPTAPAQHDLELSLAQPDRQAARSAEAGMFLPTTEGPRTDSQTGYVLALVEYDSARDSLRSESRIDVSLLTWLALRAGLLYTQHPEQLRPSLGVRAQVLSQLDAALDLGVGLYYRPEGFTEAEGELELVVAFARRFGRLGSYANLVYGQDPEARERDGELRLATLYALTAELQAGLDARLRVDLGSDDEKRRAEGAGDWDFVCGPTVSYAAGPLALVAQAGLSVLQSDSTHVGAMVLAGVGGAI